MNELVNDSSAMLFVYACARGTSRDRLASAALASARCLEIARHQHRRVRSTTLRPGAPKILELRLYSILSLIVVPTLLGHFFFLREDNYFLM